MKLALVTVIFVLLAAGSLLSADLQLVSETHSALLRQTLDQALTTPIPVAPGRFHEFDIELADTLVADTARYALVFRVSETSQLALHLGGFVVAFPDEFDLTRAEAGELTDDHPELLFTVNSTVIANNTITIGIDKSRLTSGPINTDSTIVFSIVIADVINTRLAGIYHLAALAYDNAGDIMAGPALSTPFRVHPLGLQSLWVRPAMDTTVPAGTMVSLSAGGVDLFGNMISDLGAVWSLKAGSDPIGDLDGSLLLATTAGTVRVKASYGGFEAESGLITVLPGPLALIDLDIPLQQLVDQPLFGPVTATLRDAYGNLRTAHDLAAEPLHLSCEAGVLAPSILDDNNLFGNGIIDIAAAGVTYHGHSAQTVLTATIGGVFSSGEAVSFSGYDIVEVLGGDDTPLSRLRAGSISAVKVQVRNNGLLAPSRLVGAVSALRAHGGRDSSDVAGTSGGRLETITMELPVGADSLMQDTLQVHLETAFSVSGAEYPVTAERTVAVDLVQPVLLSLASPTVGPDTIYPGSPFPLTFAILASGLNGASVDSSGLRVTFPDGRELFQGRIGPSSVSGDTIFYENIPATLQLEQMLPLGSFTFEIAYVLYSAGDRFTLQVSANPTLVLPLVDLAYVQATLSPRVVAAGSQASFLFRVNLGSSYEVEVVPSTSSITVQGTAFSASTSLISSLGPLVIGENLIQTESVFIPETQLGNFLSATGLLVLRIPSAAALDTFAFSFGTETVEVRDLPVAQVVALEVIAPNAPNVNTGQSFQLHGLVANLSSTPLGPVRLALTSNGASTFDSSIVLDLIEAEDTVDVFFDCVAAATPTAAEIFRLNIRSVQLEQVFLQPPEDDLALVRIQTPARLVLEYTLFGVANGIVDHQSPFGLTVEINNNGEASTGSGSYRLTTGGVEFGTNDTLTGTILVGPHKEFLFTSPSFDTSALFQFDLLSVPFDLNIGAPAEIDRETFSFTIRVESQDVDLFASVEPLGSNLIRAADSKNLFRISLTNRGTSSLTQVRLESIALDFKDMAGDPVSAASLVNPEMSAIIEGTSEVPVQLLFSERMLVNFENFAIASGQTRSLDFNLGFTERTPSTFVISFGTQDIDAVFSGGPQDGNPVLVQGPDGQALFSRTYVVHGAGLEESFVIENNPFNPLEQPAVFAYDLDKPSRVEFRVFTLTGEEVYAEDIPSDAALIGERQIEWDGRNNEGGMISNGVYIVSLRVVATGETARMKVAVVK